VPVFHAQLFFFRVKTAEWQTRRKYVKNYLNLNGQMTSFLLNRLVKNSVCWDVTLCSLVELC